MYRWNTLLEYLKGGNTSTLNWRYFSGMFPLRVIKQCLLSLCIVSSFVVYLCFIYLGSYFLRETSNVGVKENSGYALRELDIKFAVKERVIVPLKNKETEKQRDFNNRTAKESCSIYNNLSSNVYFCCDASKNKPRNKRQKSKDVIPWYDAFISKGKRIFH